MPIDFTSTHRTLNNMDILPLIIEHLYSRPRYQGLYRRRCLSPDPTFNLHGCAAFARVCKVFLEPALDVLWRTQVNFRATLALVPQLLDSDSSKSPTLSEEQRERLFYYTTRVKEFEYRPSRRFQDDADGVLRKLALVCHNRPIFPSLTHLYLERTWPLSLSVASLLFSPSIRSLIIDRVHKSAQLWSKMNVRQQDRLCTQLLIRNCPSIRQFILQYSKPAPGKEYDTFNIIFQAMHHLESITFYFWYKKARKPGSLPEVQRCQWLQTISHSPHVRSLLFFVDAISDHQISTIQLAEFRGLEELTLKGRPSVMFEVVRHLKSPRLRAVDLFICQPFLTESDLYGYLRSVDFLASHASHTLTSLHLHEYVDTCPARDRPNPMSLTTLIRLLHPLYHLERLAIRLPDVYVSDGDLITIASSLPRLRNLSIIHRSSPGTVVTHHALVELPVRCLSLEDLYLPISIDSFDNLEGVESTKGPPNHPLRRLFPADSYNGSLTDGEQRLKIAHAIYALFPNIMVHQCVLYGGEHWWNRILQEILLLQERDGSRSSTREDFEERLRKVLKWGEYMTEE